MITTQTKVAGHAPKTWLRTKPQPKETANKGYTHDVVPPELQEIIDKGVAEYKAGKCISFKSTKEMIKYFK
jgi:hypothetical protein